MRPRLLDLCCKAGGASEGYRSAGFAVFGIDVEPQPNYRFEFVQCDAIEYLRQLASLTSSTPPETPVGVGGDPNERAALSAEAAV